MWKTQKGMKKTHIVNSLHYSIPHRGGLQRLTAVAGFNKGRSINLQIYRIASFIYISFVLIFLKSE